MIVFPSTPWPTPEEVRRVGKVTSAKRGCTCEFTTEVEYDADVDKWLVHVHHDDDCPAKSAPPVLATSDGIWQPEIVEVGQHRHS